MIDANDSPFKTKSTKIVYKNQWIEVEENAIVRPNGEDGIYSVVNAPDGVTIVAENDEKKILLIHVYSYPGKKWHWELPSGGGEGEDFEVAAKRELQEETGMVANRWEQIGWFRPVDGLMPGHCAVMLARELAESDYLEADDRGIIDEKKFFSVDEINEMIRVGAIDEATTVVALYYYLLHQKAGTERK